MPSKAKRDKERKWKLARNAVWGCVPARLSSEVPATWVPATELVPGGERAPWSSRSYTFFSSYTQNPSRIDLLLCDFSSSQSTVASCGPRGRRASHRRAASAMAS